MFRALSPPIPAKFSLSSFFSFCDKNYIWTINTLSFFNEILFTFVGGDYVFHVHFVVLEDSEEVVDE